MTTRTASPHREDATNVDTAPTRSGSAFGESLCSHDFDNLPLEVERHGEPRNTPLSTSSGSQLAKTLREEADKFTRKAASSRELHGEGSGLFYAGVADGLRLAASKVDGFILANDRDHRCSPEASATNTER
jgi:hypothetical protein